MSVFTPYMDSSNTPTTTTIQRKKPSTQGLYCSVCKESCRLGVSNLSLDSGPSSDTRYTTYFQIEFLRGPTQEVPQVCRTTFPVPTQHQMHKGTILDGPERVSTIERDAVKDMTYSGTRRV